MTPAVILVMGVSGSGKTTVATSLATALDAEMIEADDYHSAENIERMRHGIPLDDAARAPWLRAVHAAIVERVEAGRHVVVACSALKAAYRYTLLAGLPNALVVYLRVDKVALERRLRLRHGHFMPGSLLDSQLADLEPPSDAMVVNDDAPPAQVIDDILAALDQRSRGPGPSPSS
jgi:gluconokinase